jgi:hypothetical protein
VAAAGEHAASGVRSSVRHTIGTSGLASWVAGVHRGTEPRPEAVARRLTARTVASAKCTRNDGVAEVALHVRRRTPIERSIGLDVHAARCTAVVTDARGERVGAPHVLETNGQARVTFVKTQPGHVPLCLEEGTQSAWLVEILGPHVAARVVVHVREARGPKDDPRAAYALAARLRSGAIETRVYKQVGPFATRRQLAKTHAMVVQDTVRTQNRIKALCRARGVALAGTAVHRAAQRADWLAQLPASAQGTAALRFAQYDAACEVRDRAHTALVLESKRHAITPVLATCPGLGEIRVAQRLSVVVAPERVRTRQPFWSYCGLGIVMRSSSDCVQSPQGAWSPAQAQQTRGLNRDHNTTLTTIVSNRCVRTRTLARDGARARCAA